VAMSVCLSVNTTTPEPLAVSSSNFRGIMVGLKGRPVSKMAIVYARARLVIKRLTFYCVSLAPPGEWQ